MAVTSVIHQRTKLIVLHVVALLGLFINRKKRRKKKKKKKKKKRERKKRKKEAANVVRVALAPRILLVG